MEWKRDWFFIGMLVAALLVGFTLPQVRKVVGYIRSSD